MFKQVYILFLAALGLLIGPVQSVAAIPVKAERTCCEEMPAAPCCDDSDAGEGVEHCHGECDCVGCTCSVHLVGSPLFVFHKEDSSFIPYREKKQVFFFLDQFHSSFFLSIWLPPKIG